MRVRCLVCTKNKVGQPQTKFHCKLIVWERAIELCAAIYVLARKFPREEIYGLTSQIRRASVSIASNIAEGYGRVSRGEYKQFVAIALGSYPVFPLGLRKQNAQERYNSTELVPKKEILG